MPPYANADANARAMSSELTTNSDGSVLASSASSAGATVCSRRGAFALTGDDYLAGLATIAGQVQCRCGSPHRDQYFFGDIVGEGAEQGNAFGRSESQVETVHTVVGELSPAVAVGGHGTINGGSD
jgi:hypothetical protein